jgi:acyl-CoA synthetase (NDP forming)
MAHDAFKDGGALHSIFHPTTVAVIGAAAEPGTLGHKALAGLTAGGFEGSVVAVDSGQQSNAFGVCV